jgi:hypothetical protein
LTPRLLSAENLHQTSAASIQYPVRRRDLVALPVDYTALLKKASDAR